MKKNNKAVWRVVLSVSVVCIIGGLAYLCWYLGNIYMSGREYDILKEEISSTVSSQAVDDSIDSTTLLNNSSEEDNEIDNSNKSTDSNLLTGDVINGDINFTELWELNPDVYAWIKIPNTSVDYPILQSDTDDSYYLTHNIYNQYTISGSIYTESLNKKDFSDPNTLIYGHNMLNGSMFATLHKFRNPDFFSENEYIYIYMPDRTLTYRIFSAYEYDDRHIMYSFDFNDENVYRDYLEYAQNPTSSITYNTRELGVTTDDKIITLSTCMDSIDTSRYLVQGVLVNDEPTNQ